VSWTSLLDTAHAYGAADPACAVRADLTIVQSRPPLQWRSQWWWTSLVDSLCMVLLTLLVLCVLTINFAQCATKPHWGVS
jgi:hypothetical protein